MIAWKIGDRIRVADIRLQNYGQAGVVIGVCEGSIRPVTVLLDRHDNADHYEHIDLEAEENP